MHYLHDFLNPEISMSIRLVWLFLTWNREQQDGPKVQQARRLCELSSTVRFKQLSLLFQFPLPPSPGLSTRKSEHHLQFHLLWAAYRFKSSIHSNLSAFKYLPSDQPWNYRRSFFLTHAVLDVIRFNLRPYVRYFSVSIHAMFIPPKSRYLVSSPLIDYGNTLRLYKFERILWHEWQFVSNSRWWPVKVVMKLISLFCDSQVLVLLQFLHGRPFVYLLHHGGFHEYGVFHEWFLLHAASHGTITNCTLGGLVLISRAECLLPQEILTADFGDFAQFGVSPRWPCAMNSNYYPS